MNHATEWKKAAAYVNCVGGVREFIVPGDWLVPVEYGGFGDRRGTGVIALGDLVREYLLQSNASHYHPTTAAATTTVAEQSASPAAGGHSFAPTTWKKPAGLKSRRVHVF